MLASWRHTGYSALDRCHTGVFTPASCMCICTGAMAPVFLHRRHAVVIELASSWCLRIGVMPRCTFTGVMSVSLHWRHAGDFVLASCWCGVSALASYVGVSTLASCRYHFNTFNAIMSTSLLPCNILHSTAYTTTLPSTASSKMPTANTSCNSPCHCVN